MLESDAKGSLNQQILYNLKRHIIGTGLQPGDRLPPERELAATLGVSRNTLREALRSLQTIGILSRVPGRGSILQEVDFGSIAEMSQFMVIRSSEDIESLFVVRRLLEVNILPLVARNATEEEFARLLSSCDEMDRMIESGDIGTDADAKFHQMLLDATHNGILSQFGVLIQEYMRRSRARVQTDEAGARRSVEEHRQILNYLREHRIEDAKKLMKRHLDVYIKRGTVNSGIMADDE